MYSTGHLTDPQPKDRHYPDFCDAVQAVLDACVDDDVWAVRRHEIGEILAVVYQSEVFLP
jgi:hypothetical protein